MWSIRYQIHKYTKDVEMNKTNDFEEEDLLEVEKIFVVESNRRFHWFVMDREQLSCLLELESMKIRHQHINRRHQDLQEVW